MPEERPAVEDRMITRIADDVGELKIGQAALKAGFDQMDKRISNLEGLQRWGIGLMVTTLLAVVGLMLTVLARLP